MEEQDVLWDRLAGSLVIYVENYIIATKKSKKFGIEPSYKVDYEIKNIEDIVNGTGDYWANIVSGCRNINNLPIHLKLLVQQFLPKFFEQFPKYKNEKSLKVK